MTTADRSCLVRCTLWLSSLAWILPACVLGLSAWLVHDLTGINPLASPVSEFGDSSFELGLASLFHGHSLAAFSMALAVFAIFAVGSLLAVLGVLTGRQAVRVGGLTAPVLVGILTAGLYLATVAGILGASVA